MKIIFVLASLALSALAQSATIVSPTNGTTITSGSQLVIDVHQEVRLSSPQALPLDRLPSRSPD